MGRWHTAWARLRDVARLSRLERDIDDELRFHVEEELEAGVRRGLTRDQARREAHDSLGGTPFAVREAVRDALKVSILDDLRRDLRQSVRQAARNPLLTAIVAGTLAVAIGAAVTVFSITDAWLFRPLGFPHADRLTVAFAATSSRPDEPAVWMPYRAYVAFKESSRTFASVSAAAFQPATWRTSSGAKSLVGMRVTPEFFSTFGVPAIRGRVLGTADANGPPAVVLGYGFWQRDLGGADVVGRSVTLSDASYIVVGVMPADFDVRLLDQREGAAFWTILRTGERGYDRGGIGPVAIVGRLKDGVASAAAKAEVMTILRQSESAYARNFNQPTASGETFVVNLSSLQADNTRTVRATLLTVLAAAACLLLIASTNVGGLLLGRGLGRRAEVALRQALGAGRGRLMRQFLTESLLLSACGGVLGVGIAVVATRLFVAWNPLETLPGNAVQLDLRALAITTVAMAVTAIVAGLVPAIRMSTVAPADHLRGGDRGRVATPALRSQRAMLVAQMAVSMTLLVCAALLAKTFVQLRTERLGFEPSGVTVATVVLPTQPFPSTEARNVFVDQAERQLLALPGVTAAAAATTPPLEAGPPVRVNLTAADNLVAPRISEQAVTAGFFEALRVPVIAGRTFDGRDAPKSAPVIVLNEKAARDLFGDPHSAVGRRVRLDDEPWREVIGVVGNVRTTFFNTLAWRTDAMLYRPATQAFGGLAPMATSFTVWIHVRAERALTFADINAAAMAAGPRAAVTEVQRVADMVSAATRQPTFRMSLLLWFCAISLLLAAIGVYGLVTQAVNERSREIALRMALGASRRDVVLGFVRAAVVSGAVGLAIGLGLTMMLARTLESLLYGARPGDAVALSVAGALLLVVIGLAACVPAMRATRSDAMDVLRA